MDPGGSQPDPGLSQRGTPCLIVADSQPESVGPEEDAEQACLGVLARRLPVRRSPSPVLVSGGPARLGSARPGPALTRRVPLSCRRSSAALPAAGRPRAAGRTGSDPQVRAGRRGAPCLRSRWRALPARTLPARAAASLRRRRRPAGRAGGRRARRGEARRLPAAPSRGSRPVKWRPRAVSGLRHGRRQRGPRGSGAAAARGLAPCRAAPLGGLGSRRARCRREAAPWSTSGLSEGSPQEPPR